MFEDKYAKARGHQIMTPKLAETIPPIGAFRNVEDIDDVKVTAKLFSPYSDWTWYITEMDQRTGQCFGLVQGLETEIGYFNLDELAEVMVAGTVPAVERDLYFHPKTIGEIKKNLALGLKS